MTIFEHWQAQKDALQSRIQHHSAVADVAYQVRHTILQTEQNALSEMSDDILRQQCGVLFSCLKTSIGLMEASDASQICLPQKSSKVTKQRLIPGLISWGLLLLLALYCYEKGLLVGAFLALCSLALGVFSLLRKSEPPLQTETHITLNTDIDRLFSILDGQMRSIDRYIHDFSYLNDHLRCGNSIADDASLSHAADLFEALYECNEEERTPAEEAAKRLLASMGLRVVDYSTDTSRLFNTLPSKSTTRTLSPAIVSAQDQHLLRRGTAAVRTP